ncbi:hypothetical protein M1N78_01965 [Peptococcaceae bacterium]|nr:hypothetical protein [Peptococcaceae bacterium]
MVGVYFAVTFGITTVVFLFIKKYFSILVSLLMSLSSFVLLSLFSFLIVNLGMWRSIFVYSVVIIMIGIVLAYKIHKEQDRDDLSASVAIGGVDVPIGDLNNNDNEDISMKNVSRQKSDGELSYSLASIPKGSSHAEITRTLTVNDDFELGNELQRSEFEHSNKNKLSPQEARKEKGNKREENTAIVEYGECEIEESVDEKASKNTDFSVKETVEEKETIGRCIEKNDIEGQPKEVQGSDEKKSIEEIEGRDSEVESVEEGVGDIIEEDESKIDESKIIEEKNRDNEGNNSGLSAKELTASALNYYQSNDYKEALRMFLEALKKDPDIELKYVIVSKLSTIYQQLGMYELANEVLSLYLEKKDFKKHPNINILQTKRLFLSNIIRLLKENNIPSLPYEKLPDYIKKKAFIEAKQNR